MVSFSRKKTESNVLWSESLYLLYRKPVTASSPPPLGFEEAPSSPPALLVETIVYI